MSTIKVDNLQTTGGAGLYPARAWVNFNGAGTVAIRADGNVSSITDVGTASYRTNFSTSFSSASYSISGTARDNVGGSSCSFTLAGASLSTLTSAYQTGSCYCRAVTTSDALRDSDSCSLALVD